MENKLILTFDIGTTAVKVCLFSSKLDRLVELELICSFAEEYSLETAPNGRAEVNPQLYKTAIKAGLSKALASHEGQICSIAVTTQGETIIPVDENGEPLMNAIVWLDSRAQTQAEYFARQIDPEEFYKTTGLPEINGALPLAKLAYIKQELPHIYEKTYKFLLVEDYVLHWLTGVFITEKALQCSTGYFDIISDCYWDKALDLAEIDKNKLPDAVSCGEPVGKILDTVAKELHISSDAVVVTGAMDQVAAALGAGCVQKGMIVETTGTALVMAAFTNAPNFEQKSKVTIYRHAIDNSYIYLPIGNTAGMMLKWFREEFCENDCEKPMSYSAMDELAKTIHAGCDGLITLPFLAGMVNPDNLPHASGVFFGATLATTKAHFIRSIMESICYMLRDFIDMLDNLGVRANCIHSLGGGSRSVLWEQMKADICQKDYASMQCSEMASMGVAILAAKGIGLLSKEELSSAQTAKIHKNYTPNPELVQIYSESYQHYKKLYDTIKPLYER